jgi:hypothetical protein
MTKPASIVLFDRLYLGSLAIGVLNFIVGWSDISEKLARNPEFAATGFGTGFMIAIFAISMAINLVIWFFISLRASKIAKWILVAFFVIGLASMLGNLNNPMGPEGLSLAVTIVITLAQAAAIYMLFRPDAVAWFNRTPPIDPDTFR